jgi:hypothetical protein
MSAELLKSIFDWATVAFIALTVITGSGAIITGSTVNHRQETRLRQFDKDLTDAQTDLGKQQERAARLESENLSLKTDLEKAKIEAAKAQLELRRYIDQVDRKAGPRRLDRERFLEQLKDKPTGMAFVTYKPEDVEAFQFANQLSAILQAAGWNAPAPMPFGGRQPRHFAIPFEVMHGGAFGSGVTIKCKNPNPEVGEHSAVGALVDALTIATEGRGGVEIVGNPDLRENVIEIIIGQKK